MKKQRFPPVEAPRFDGVTTYPELALTSDFSGDGYDVRNVTAEQDDLSHIELAASRFTGARFSGLIFDNLSLVDVVFEDCELSGTILASTNLMRVRFSRCRMSSFDASGLKARDVSFADCKLDEANFRMSSWDRCEFVDCDLHGADFGEAQLTRSAMRRCNLERGHFSRVTLKDVSLHGSSLTGMTGVEYIRGAVIDSNQILSLAPALLTALGIEVSDEI